MNATYSAVPLYVPLCLGEDNHVYEGTILQRNYRKMTISWSFFYNSFVKFLHIKNIWEPQHDLLYPNLCYNEACFKGTGL